MPIMGERSFLKLMAPVKLSTTSASHVSFSPIAHSSPAISAKLTHLFSSADRPAAMAITSATTTSGIEVSIVSRALSFEAPRKQVVSVVEDGQQPACAAGCTPSS